MSEKEIIKALECLCGYALKCRECPYSPRYEFPLCQRQVAKDTLDLLTRQQAEYENLKVENQSLRTAANSLKMHYEEAQAKIERLRKSLELVKGAKYVYSYDGETLEYCVHSPCPICKTTDQIKSEAYKEVFEKLNKKAEVEKITDKKFPFIIRVVTLHDINELKKEMVGD